MQTADQHVKVNLFKGGRRNSATSTGEARKLELDCSSFPWPREEGQPVNFLEPTVMGLPATPQPPFKRPPIYFHNLIKTRRPLMEVQPCCLFLEVLGYFCYIFLGSRQGSKYRTNTYSGDLAWAIWSSSLVSNARS